MCRIAVVPKGYNSPKIVALLAHLEQEKGGDGNGFAWFKAGEPWLLKGVKVKPGAITKVDGDSAQVLYHTRWASAGETNDDNTQPFISKSDEGKPFFLCHNGTWTSYSDYKKVLLMLGKLKVAEYKDWSDTHLMAYLIQTQGEDRLNLPESGVWVKYFGDYSIVHIKSGDFCAYKLGKQWVYASEFPEDEYKKIWKFKDASIIKITAEDGFKVLAGPKPTYEDNKSYSYSNYRDTGYRSYGYGADGWRKSEKNSAATVTITDKDGNVKTITRNEYYHGSTWD